jgi:hypothetical protein
MTTQKEGVMATKKNLFVFACLLGGCLFIPMAASAATAPATTTAKAVLSQEDCIKCHDQAPQDIASNGAAHKTQITCVDCHAGHPPKVKQIIPQCSQCHSGTDHFKLADCLSCHKNPHTPLVISLADNLTEPCLTCHTDQMAQLQQKKSKHTDLACSSCHKEKHKFIPNCAECHSPHVPGQTQADCLTCHKPHMPLEVTYPDSTPSSACAACHDVAYKELAASPFKHSKLQCATCHKAKHKMIPECQGCHGASPHPAPMHAKFPNCGQCHGTAHNLNI